ncbi:hypothetical protein P5V15_015807 [Pogonomyrmex californicus]
MFKAEPFSEIIIARIEKLGLEISADKTVACVFCKKGLDPPLPLPNVKIQKKSIDISTKIKYLGLFIDVRLSFRDYLMYVIPRAKKMTNSLSRIMPNLGVLVRVGGGYMLAWYNRYYITGLLSGLADWSIGPVR